MPAFPTCSRTPPSFASPPQASAKATCTTWRSRRRRRITVRNKLACAALGALAAAAYANAFASQFVFDNKVIILEDPRLRSASAQHLGEIVTHSYWWPYATSALYRPLTTFTYLLNYSVLGNADQPAGYHAVNLLLHAANACLLFLLAERLTRRFVPALLAAAIWTVHPLLTEAVTNIVGRADLLSAFGVLTAVWCHVRASEPGAAAWRWRSGVAIGASIAAFSKESGIATVGMIALYDVLIARRQPLARLLAGWLPAAVPAVVFLVARVPAIEGAAANDFPFVDNPIIGAPFLTAKLTALAVAGRYVSLVFWPATLSADYSYSQIPLASGTPWELAAWALIALLGAGTLLLYRHSRAGVFALLGAVLAFLPASNLFFATGTIMAERLMYLPSAGVVAVLVFVVAALAARAGARRAGVGLAVAAIAALAARTVVRNRDWRDDLTLWTATAAAAPASSKAHSGLAEAMYQADPTRSNLAAVVAEKERSLAVLASASHPEAAIKPFSQAAAYYLELGESLEAHGGSRAEVTRAFSRSAELSRRFLELLPASRALPNPPSSRDESDVLLMLSSATTRLNDPAQAIDAAQRSRSAEPFTAVRYQGEAAALLAAGRTDDAAVALMAGFMITGDVSLRTALADVYRSGLDRERCAVSSGPSGIVLNAACPVVHQHLCAASRLAVDIYTRAARRDLADRTRQNAVTQFRCAE